MRAKQATLVRDPAHKLESNVRSYVRSLPLVADVAKGEWIYSEDGDRYLDFLAGAGALNYGHNNEKIKQGIIDYLQADRIVHGLDLATIAKHEFLETLAEVLLGPRDLDYRVQFCGPTGTNGVEAAIKLARIYSRRRGIISFTNNFHGMTAGALAITGNDYHKAGVSNVYAADTAFMPFCNYSPSVDDSIAYIHQYLSDNSSGVSLPAAMILETVQGEGGINVASANWLLGIRTLCDEFGILLIIDDVQMGCGRTGEFFSFEEANIRPDIVVLSKSIGAYGLPLALVLLSPELDIWKPAQHNGTFRGHNLAFVAARSALEVYWRDRTLTEQVFAKGKMIEERLQGVAQKYPALNFEVRGRGLVWGLESLVNEQIAGAVQSRCFANKLILETCGGKGQVLKIMPPLTIEPESLMMGLDIIVEAIAREIDVAI